MLMTSRLLCFFLVAPQCFCLTKPFQRIPRGVYRSKPFHSAAATYPQPLVRSLKGKKTTESSNAQAIIQTGVASAALLSAMPAYALEWSDAQRTAVSAGTQVWMVASSFVETIMVGVKIAISSELFNYFLHKFIDLAIPVAAIAIVFGVVTSKDRDMDGEQESIISLLAKKKKKSVYDLKVVKINDEIRNVELLMQTAMNGQNSAARANRKAQLDKVFGADLLRDATDEQRKKLLKACEECSAEFQRIDAAMQRTSKDIRAEALEIGSTNSSMMQSMMKRRKTGSLQMKYSELFDERCEVEMKHLKEVQSILGSEDQTRLEGFMQGYALSPLGLNGAPGAPSLLADTTGTVTMPQRVFHLDFKGDTTASQVEQLRREITAVLSAANSSRGDSVVLKLESPGGTVTGYGLAAAQLERIRNANLHLTIVVGQVAASGGYLMACVANRIVAGPLTVLGSIGVITDIPNVYERLTKEGIVFNTVTAGKYKRQLTPTKMTTEEDLNKTKADLEDILTLFKGFVHRNRPQLDIDKVATGETWFGPDALALNLCDEIGTIDDVLLAEVHQDKDVLFVSTDKGKENNLQALFETGSLVGALEETLIGMGRKLRTAFAKGLLVSDRDPRDAYMLRYEDELFARYEDEPRL